MAPPGAAAGYAFDENLRQTNEKLMTPGFGGMEFIGYLRMKGGQSALSPPDRQRAVPERSAERAFPVKLWVSSASPSRYGGSLGAFVLG